MMLDKVLKIMNDIHHPDKVEAMREIGCVLAAVKYYQVVLKRMDRVIQAAIDEAVWMRNNELVQKLKNLLEPVKVPYEELMI